VSLTARSDGRPPLLASCLTLVFGRDRTSTTLIRAKVPLYAAVAVATGALAFLAMGCGSSRAAVPKACVGTGFTAHHPRGRAVPRLKHVVVVMFENKEYGDVIGSSQAPTFNRLARRGALFTRYCAVSHPSLPNYLALISGSTHGIQDDCTDCSVSGRNLADTLGRAGRSWKAYAEGLPHPGFTGAGAGLYAKKHDPFVYFRDISSSPRRLARVVPLTRFHRDLARRSLPSLSFVVPNLCHDMHDCSVAQGDHWLAKFMRPLLKKNRLRNGAVFIVFDEGDEGDVAGGGGHTIALAVGPTVKSGSRYGLPVSHYNLLRTIEVSLGLPFLGRSNQVHPIRGVWR
jgi:phosphatidylinositol-3-phosphatase